MPPLVLVHGAGGAHLYWPPEIRRLPGCRTFALDLPGHGKSGGHGEQSIQAYARSVFAWLEAVGLGKAVFAGHSMGGAVAQVLALDYPEQVQGLILLGAGARMRVHPALLQFSANEAIFHRAVSMVIKYAFSPHAPARLVELAAQRMAETRPSVLHGDFMACDTFDVTERIGEIRQPTLVITGAEDQLTPVRYAQFLASQIPGAQLEVIPNAGHMVMLEQPEIVAGAMKAYLDSLPFE